MAEINQFFASVEQQSIIENMRSNKTVLEPFINGV